MWEQFLGRRFGGRSKAIWFTKAKMDKCPSMSCAIWCGGKVERRIGLLSLYGVSGMVWAYAGGGDIMPVGNLGRYLTFYLESYIEIFLKS